jgi:arylsulfatase A-like enzyme
MPRREPSLIEAARLWRRTRCALLCSALLAGLSGCSGGEVQRPPNLLLVVLDTARGDAVTEAPTPTLDRLAAQGVRFTQARSTSAWTVPAHGSLFTGLYPSRHGAHHEHPFLLEDRVTLAELLAPTHEGAAFSENVHIGPGRGFHRGFDHFEETWRLPGGYGRRPPTIERVARWLEGRDDPDRPFHLFVNLMDPHLPYDPPGPFAPHPEGPEAERLLALARFNEWDARMVIAGRASLGRLELDWLRRLYLGEVAFVDARLGSLVGILRDRGELHRTLVVVVSDHGENIGEHGLMEHQFSLHETLLRIPMVWWLPGVFEGGIERNDPVQLVDVAPTVLDALFVPSEGRPRMEGVSLLQGRPLANRRLVAEYMRPIEQRPRFAEIAPELDFDPFERRLEAVIHGHLKLLVKEGEEPRLYDLDVDPGELQDVAAERQETVAELLAWLEGWRGGARPVTAPPPIELDEEAVRRLRSLGYQ